MKLYSEKKIIVILLSFFISLGTVFADEIYKVEKGDTLYSISKKYQITLAELRTANNLSENDIIKIGQKLVIPTADITNAVALATDNSAKKNETKTSELDSSKKSDTSKKTDDAKEVFYTVVKGDTLYGIAKKYNMTVAEILTINNLDSSAVIKIGQKIKIKQAVELSSSKKEDTKKEEKKVFISETSNDNVKTPDTRTYGNTISADSTTVWPVVNPTVTTVKGKVSGVQLSAQMNEAVKCIHEGTVMFVGVYRGFGQLVFVQSKTGIIYAYAGLGSIKVKKGDYVNFGTELATAGVDSITGKPQITFMVFQNSQPIDPAKAPRN